MLRAFRETPLSTVRAVIIGQDPYHGAGQACGLAFAVPPGTAEPPSLRALVDEAARDCGFPRPRDPDLTTWARRGVLLLNDVLTVRDGAPGSHADLGWEVLTDRALEEVARLPRSIGFIVLGAKARAKLARVAAIVCMSPHVVVQAPHPAARPPLTLRGKRPFTRLNVGLIQLGARSIDWSLP